MGHLAEAIDVTSVGAGLRRAAGPPTMPWLEPDVNDALRAYAAEGALAVVLVPINSFPITWK